MFGGWHDVFIRLAAMVAVGAAVKLMDDYLDAEFDLCLGKRTLAARWGRATLPYALVLALIGCSLDRTLAVSLFFGSYAVGMLSQFAERMPTRVPAYVEMALAFMTSVLLAGWRSALWGVAMMAVIDWLDDFMDRLPDKQSGQRNLAVRIGTVETLMLMLIALCIAVLCDGMDTAIAFVAAVLLYAAAEWTTTCRRHVPNDDGVSVG
ncbi:hypothetical protein GCM10010885_11910 [Alicyclobacillus cellulosilyticus]|uniref:Uncharacterized protein n=1 Tax=Alicyclobacillus cellulosilyticus TaxID=1003997 RepID=A0A917KAA8_9BACL|nr:hypothetical protein [Alicyclobacillus cellulosilyticus]GGJ04253.1 hypothetical protein GCM10010885_11910 [Alicyclobacillus cellulosilyticus]